ncbi:hypothetical protein J7T55_010567 [Diaporthe amygdali]|uniref:uncharacterized protein n=1 Tax=Phomopsis amygdali TaxID=1214568 RepID=UPI0022FDEA34|nr:uncharacterized protein J7T55_010567 [Diaporthe amygdali]KAJ0115744.1 hypothetical protein J7T55_010567 [Diaporthe amygdali]
MAPSRADPWQPVICPPRSSPCRLRPFPISALVFVLAILASHFGLCAADASDDQLSVTWIYPQGGEVFRYLDTVNVSYRSPYPDPWLYTFCYQNETANSVRQIRMQEAEPYDAFVLIPINFTSSTPCWFNLRENTKENKGSNSEKWSLTEIRRQSGPITTGAPVPSATTTPSPTSSLSRTATSTVARASSNDGFSSGAKAGLGIGVGLGTALICAGVFWLYYRHIKKKEHHREVYRRIVGEQGRATGQDGHKPPDEHLEPWRYGNTPQPGSSAAGSAYYASSGLSTNWCPSEVTVNAPYQYYDPVGSSHHVAASHRYPAESVAAISVATASASAPAPASVVRGFSTPRPDHVPDAAAIRDVQDLSSSLYPSEFNEPVSPVSADRDIPPARVSSVNYGPTGRLDASTGADFALLPDYASPIGGNENDDPDDIYGPPTPRTPPPPHSAHIRTANEFPPQLQQQQVPQELASQPSSRNMNAVVSELPAAESHRGFGPQAELPAGEVLRHQRSDQQSAEQKFRLQDVAPLRTGQHRDGG